MLSLEGAKFQILALSSKGNYEAIAPKFGRSTVGTDVSRTSQKLRKILKNELARGRQISHLDLF